MTAQPKRLAALAVAVLAAVGGLAACGKSSSSGNSNSATSGKPVSGGTLNIVAAGGPDHLDSVPAYTTYDYAGARLRAPATVLPDSAGHEHDQLRVDEGHHTGT